MKFNRIWFLIVLSFFILRANCQENKPSSNFELLTYGLNRSNTYQNAKNIVADRWGIHFKPIAQCLISQELKDSARIFNNHSDSLISLKYGKNWRKQFDQEIASEELLVKKFISQIKILDCISKLDSTLAQENNQVHYLVYPYSTSRSEKKYEVFVYGWGILDGKTDIVCYYKYKLHKKKTTIELVTDKPSFLFTQDL